MRVFSKDKPVVISCYGDSNTRYYLGDQQVNGAAEDSYPAKLQRLFTEAGYQNVTVVNNGYPDMQTDFALEHFEENARGAHLCILGFGTNNIRQPMANLSTYLRELCALLRKCKADGIEPMALLIPWYTADYAGVDAQARLPFWNRALAGLCAEAGVPTVDTYNIFKADPERFFNEKCSARRHYSAAATEVIARMIFDMLAPCIR